MSASLKLLMFSTCVWDGSRQPHSAINADIDKLFLLHTI